jgi:hypothetical protein
MQLKVNHNPQDISCRSTVQLKWGAVHIHILHVNGVESYDDESSFVFSFFVETSNQIKSKSNQIKSNQITS